MCDKAIFKHRQPGYKAGAHLDGTIVSIFLVYEPKKTICAVLFSTLFHIYIIPVIVTTYMPYIIYKSC